MSSLKDARDMTLISHSQGLITDEELLLLLEENTSRNPDFTYDAYDRFDLENMEEAECKSEQRVEKRDIALLAEALGLPDTFAQKYFKFEKDWVICKGISSVSLPHSLDRVNNSFAIFFRRLEIYHL